MKSIKYVALMGIILGFLSCKSQDSVFEEFIVPNGHKYPAPIQNPTVKSGNKRIELSFNRGIDYKVVKVRIFWSNYTDSVEIAITEDTEIVTKIIEPLAESTYTFMIHTYDAEGNVSVPVEITGRAYGNNYINSLANRVLKSAVYNGEIVTLNWYVPNKTEIVTNLTYSDAAGNSQIYVVEPSDDETILEDIDVLEPLIYSTVYKPDFTVIDEFHALPSRLMVDPYLLLPRSGWEVTYSSIQNHATVSPGNILDGDPETVWHSDPTAPNTFPHWLAVDLKNVFKVKQVILNTRSSINTMPGTVRHFMIQGSLDGATWTDYPPEDGSEYYFFQPIGLFRQTFSLEHILPEIQHIRLYMVDSHVDPAVNANQCRYAIISEFEVFAAYTKK